MTKKRAKIYWTRQARDDLWEIRSFIARDAPKTAAAYVRRLRTSVGCLRQFPELGEIVREIGKPPVRELIRGQYRVIYRYQSNRVDILTVFHSA
jgi:plasmid stabilization system protein ParE